MAEDTTLNIGTTTAVTMTINSVADAGNVTATAIDLTALMPLAVGFHAVLDGLSGSTADVEWYMLWSEDNSAFTLAAVAPLVHLSTMQGTTAFDDHFSVVPIARYVKPYLVNNSGAAMAAAGNSLEYWRITVDQV